MENIQQNNRTSFQTWKFGSINVRTAKEKAEGAKVYMITEEVANAGLAF